MDTLDALSRKLGLEDIADVREYERERNAFRRHVIEIKRARRVPVGPFVTLVFENRDTVRFQIQEMARVEQLTSDEQIRAELEIYNPLIPDPGFLSATLFVELTSKEELASWLPELVGIERSVQLRIGGSGATGDEAAIVRATVDPEHDRQLTRETVTASVHYVRFELSDEQVARFASEPVRLEIDHPACAEGTNLDEATRAALLEDLRG